MPMNDTMLESGSPAHSSSLPKNAAIGGIVVIVVIILGLIFAFSQGDGPSTPSAEELNDALRAAASTEVNVPTSENPVKQVLPKETVYDKTNPFNDAYVNPFE